ncbi:lasso peptide biosynthesis B2 protein [Sphingomonas sp. MG17]|uniref:Lasso peptide biosynthesis B2 protein n=1 Tax=Sphingomonas tagetis TaxID=2949092 RepID=A0A9X2HJS5_9SPHN|nr:lasso peptide biosynthesis B2 protein [Sphingomonas tagetis]MCP3732173.1 lasso peptide biosynthesis B2 protein [Sphingomonas tagetis]
MHLTSPDGVYFCLLGERSIFLDVERDRYFAASPETTQALIRAIEGTSVLGSDEAKLQPLLNEGLLSVSRDISRPLGEIVVTPAMRDLRAQGTARAGLAMLAVLLQVRARRELRRSGLAAVIARRAQAKPRHRHREIEAIAAAMRFSNLIIPAHERCLMKSIGLFDLMVASGHRPTLILGVRDCPFTAHAWVQLDALVIGDEQEHVTRYRPILAV